MVRMREITLQVDEDVFEWLERHRGKTGLDEFAGRLLGDHVRSGAGTTAMHEDMAKRLDELEARIKRLNVSLSACKGSK